LACQVFRYSVGYHLHLFLAWNCNCGHIWTSFLSVASHPGVTASMPSYHLLSHTPGQSAVSCGTIQSCVGIV
jgi:hypothetical protein